MALFGEQFYPSTPELVRTIRDYARIKDGDLVFDPTAGDGALLDACVRSNRNRSVQTFGGEIDPSLRVLLGDKKHKIVCTDFLKYQDKMRFDKILINPPFNIAPQVIIKAFEKHLCDGGTLVAILNQSNLNSCDRKIRIRLKQIIENHGSVAKPLGQCFNTESARRRTRVNVFLIVLQKPIQIKHYSFNPNRFKCSETQAKDFKAAPLQHVDVITSLVERYRHAERILLKRYELQQELGFYLNEIADPIYEGSNRDYHKSQEIKHCLETQFDLNDQLQFLKSKFWNEVFKKTELRSKGTSQFKNNFAKMVVQQQHMEFSKENILELLGMVIMNHDEIMQSAIADMFLQITKHCDHSSFSQGWKTNKSAVVNKKMIIPYAIEDQTWNDHLDLKWEKREFLDDLEKCCRYLHSRLGDRNPALQADNQKPLKKKATPSLYNTIDTWTKKHTGKSYLHKVGDSSFFEFKVFKAGTLHLIWKSDDLRQNFNKIAAIALRGSNTIGADY